MTARPIPVLILLAALAACGTPPPAASLPPDPGAGLADAGRGAILNTAYAFATPARLARRPADAAIAIAQAEYLAVDLDINQRWRELSPIVSEGFRQARPEWRTAAGIAQDAPPQAVIDALSSARNALLAGDAARAAAALPAALFAGGGGAALGRLAALPALPRTADAARNAENELARMSMAPDE
jgi:hypothetical protein